MESGILGGGSGEICELLESLKNFLSAGGGRVTGRG